MKFLIVLAFLSSSVFAAQTGPVKPVTCYADNLMDYSFINYQIDAKTNAGTLSFGQMNQTQISDPVLFVSDTPESFLAVGAKITLFVNKQKSVDLYASGYIEDDSGIVHHASGLGGHLVISSNQINGDIGCTF